MEERSEGDKWIKVWKQGVRAMFKREGEGRGEMEREKGMGESKWESMEDGNRWKGRGWKEAGQKRR